MPPFGTCFQSKSGPATHFRQPRRHSQAGYLPDQVHCGLACSTLARADAPPPRVPLFRSAWSRMAEMEATTTWKALPGGSYLLAWGRPRFCRS